jgi:hypothetical protein
MAAAEAACGSVYIDTQTYDANTKQLSTTAILLREGAAWEHLSPFYNAPTCLWYSLALFLELKHILYPALAA